jgi:hypothetical protein
MSLWLSLLGFGFELGAPVLIDHAPSPDGTDEGSPRPGDPDLETGRLAHCLAVRRARRGRRRGGAEHDQTRRGARRARADHDRESDREDGDGEEDSEPLKARENVSVLAHGPH